MVRLKVCCISSVDEARAAIAAGASAVGLVGRMPSGPGVIDDARIAEIARAVPPPVATFRLRRRAPRAAAPQDRSGHSRPRLLGVRTAGALDAARLGAFVTAAGINRRGTFVPTTGVG
jgi:phosphoribosylanthranilate isomerase